MKLRKLFKGLYKTCECGCGKLVSVIGVSGTFKRYEWGHKNMWKKSQWGEGNNMKNPRYVSGRSKDKQGYWRYQLPDYFSARKDGRVLEHVYNFQEFHRCCMLPWGDVHHIDENKENNMVWNLKGMTHGQHLSLHNKKDMSDRKCFECGSDKTGINKHSGYNLWLKIDNEYHCRKCGLRKRWRRKYQNIGN